MNRSHIVRIAAIGLVLVILMSSVAVSAQSGTPGNPFGPLLLKLDQIVEKLPKWNDIFNGIIPKLDEILATLSANSNEPVIAKIDVIKGSDIPQLRAKVDQILAALPPAEPERVSVTLASSPVWALGGDTVLCMLANVGTEPIHGYARLVDGNGTPMFNIEIGLAPGQSTGQGGLVLNQSARRCEFILDGPATGARAHLQTSNASGVSAIVEMR